MNRFLYTLFLTTFAVFAFSQTLKSEDIAYFKKYEDSLQLLQKPMFYGTSDSIKLKANSRFLHIMDEVLHNTLAFYYPFDSLTEIKKLTAPDKKFRILTWNIPKKDGTHVYYGFVESLHPKTRQYEVYRLNDKSLTIKNPEYYVGDNNSWFGMLYYEIIPCKDYYTLLGWDGNDKITCRKFIDVLSFKRDGTPVFGKDAFKMQKKYPRRVMFEYSAQVVMSLRYNNAMQAIVFDHLAPKDDFLEGQYQFYGPDFSYDAFFYKHNKWNYEEEVDLKNPRSKNDNVRRDKDKKEKPVYVPK